MADRQTIQSQYDADIREANAYKETDPSRASELTIAAERRRADGLDELGRSSDLMRDRAQALVDFPDADPRAVVGANIAEIRANAEESQKFVRERVQGAITATKNGSRLEVARAWSPDGKSSVPRQEIVGGGETADRTSAQIEHEIKTARSKGDTEGVLRLIRERGGMTGLDRMAESAVATAREQRGGQREATPQEIEERRG